MFGARELFTLHASRGTLHIMTHKYLEKILTSRVYDVAKLTPLEKAINLSKKVKNRVLFKREDVQSVHSFKLRGAYNKMVYLPLSALKKGVIAASAGNHAQGVALAAKVLKCEATIVMPATTPPVKVSAVENLGAKVVLSGDSYSDAFETANTLMKKKSLTFIHAYDDPDVIAGQGTIGMEILQQSLKPVDVIFVPIGGGGLASGVAAYVKSIQPKVKVVGVQPYDSSAMFQSLKAKKRVMLKQVGLFADGVAVKQVGKETFRLCQKYIDEIVLVSTDEICAAIKDVYDDARTILEPAGALSVAGMQTYVKKKKLKNKNLVCVLSGANMNFYRMRHVAERAEIGEQREALFAVRIPEKPGSFKRLINAIGSKMITEFNYRYNDPKQAHVFMGVGIEEGKERKNLLRKLNQQGFQGTDLTENELALVHLRYLIGGPALHSDHEVFYRVEFPERVGALKKFLNCLSEEWNISLFHYRNHGTDYGRVLMGLQIPKSEKKKLEKLFRDIGYMYFDETDNPACRLFLA